MLLDLGLPDSQGIETLRRMHKQKPREIPIVVLTGLGRRDALGIRAIREGAEDYLVKVGSTDTMRARSVRYAIERKRSREAALASEQRLALAVDAAQMGIFDRNCTDGPEFPGPIITLGYSGLTSEQFGGTVQDFRAVRSFGRSSRDRCKESSDHWRCARNITTNIASRLGPDGSEHWIESRGRVFNDEQDRPGSNDGHGR